MKAEKQIEERFEKLVDELNRLAGTTGKGKKANKETRELMLFFLGGLVALCYVLDQDDILKEMQVAFKSVALADKLKRVL